MAEQKSSGSGYVIPRPAGAQPLGVRSHPESNGERSVSELLGTLASETGTLVRQEMRLAVAEFSHKATYAAKQAAFVAAGGLLAVVSLLALLGAIVLGLGTVIALWLAALLVGAVVGAVALGIAIKGIAALRRMEFAPRQTLESMEENKTWIEKQIR